MSARKYPSLPGTTIVPWGPGCDHGIGGVDVAVTGDERDDRPDGGTVAVLTLHSWPDENADDDDPEMEAPFIAAELTVGDLMKLGNWAYDRVIAINGADETAGSEVQYLQVTPVADDGESVEWVETLPDIDKTTAWAVYARVLDPSDGFVKAEFLREFALRDPFYQAWEEAKEQAVRLAFILSAGRWPIEVLDPRG